MTLTAASSLPADARFTGVSPQFNASTTPAALRARHALAPANWARLILDTGSLVYLDLDTGSRQQLRAGQSLVIGPEQAHRVEFQGPVTYRLEFFRTDP